MFTLAARSAKRLAGTVAMAGVVACGGSHGECGKRCGTAIIIVGADADALLPPVTANPTSVEVSDLLFLKLADLGPSLNTVGDKDFVPRLARSWRFEDSLTLVFMLDPRARWQDGSPVTANDVVFTFDVYRDPLVASSARGVLADIVGVTARDPHTAVFKFRRRYAEQFYDATHHMRVLPQHLLDSIPRGRLQSHPFNRQPVGDGPYRLTSWQAGQAIALEADSTSIVHAGIARLVFSIVPDPSAGIAELLSGDADVMDVVGGPEQIGRLKDAANIALVPHPSTGYAFLVFNLRQPDHPSQAHPLFGNRDLRRALAAAVDRAAIARTVLGDYGAVPVGPAPRATPIGRDTTIPVIAFDTARARSELTRLGWADRGHGALERAGARLSFEILVPGTSRIRRQAAELIQDQLKRIGVDVRVTALEFNLFQDRITSGHFDAAVAAWNDDPTPSSILQTFASRQRRGANYGSYANAEFTRLVQAAVSAATPRDAMARWREAYTVINADVPAVWLFTPAAVTAVHRRFRGVTIRPDQWAATLWSWEIDPAHTLPRDLGPASR